MRADTSKAETAKDRDNCMPHTKTQATHTTHPNCRDACCRSIAHRVAVYCGADRPPPPLGALSAEGVCHNSSATNCIQHLVSKPSLAGSCECGGGGGQRSGMGVSHREAKTLLTQQLVSGGICDQAEGGAGGRAMI
jgi:hypothetical protein